MGLPAGDGQGAANREPPAREFLEGYARLFDRVRAELTALLRPRRWAHPLAGHLAWALLDRLLFLYFVQEKGLLDADPDYFYRRFLDGHAGRPDSTSFHVEVLRPLFLALGDREANRALAGSVGAAPFLSRRFLDRPPDLALSNATFQALFDELLERYHWTLHSVTTPGERRVIGPEVLGQVFERLVLEQEQGWGGGRRRATGAYYTPQPVVAFLVREALAEYLAGESGLQRTIISRLLDLPSPDRLDDEGCAWLSSALAPDESQALRRVLLNVRACDPAAGAGAFLVGLLRALASAVGHLDRRVAGEAALGRRNYAYDLKRHLVEHCLYGVDVQARVVQICRRRLWLELLADWYLPQDLPYEQAVRQVPPLEDLDCHVYQGDSLLEERGGGDPAEVPGFGRWTDLDPFREKGGFDLMVGNPPYGARVPREEWQEIKGRYPTAGSARNLAAAFLALPFDCLRAGGVACQIVPKSLSYSHGWRKSRALLWDQGCLLASADASQAFEGVLLEQEVVLYRPWGRPDPRPRSWHLAGGTFVKGHRVPLAVLKGQDALLNHLSAGAAGLLTRLLDRGRPLGTYTCTVRGQRCRSGLVQAGDRRAGARVIRGRDVRQFAVARDLAGLANDIGMEEKPGAMPGDRIVSQNIVAHVTRPYDTLIIVSAVDHSGAAALDTVNVTTPLPGCPYPLEYLAALLNSSLARWYFYFAVYNRAVRTMHFDAPYVDGFPMAPASRDQVARICDLVSDLEDRQAGRRAGEETKYFLAGDDPVYDALDEAVLNLYDVKDEDVDRVLRREQAR